MSSFNNGFNYVDKFFSSLNNYLNYNSILIIFLSIFLVSFLIVLITTSQSYEAKLIRAIDMFNNYFMKTPQITAENLLDFNNKMKLRKVPKQLRKQWQQFVLYRDKSASEYMSFEICVSSPIKNSTYKRDVKILNYVSYILAALSFVANIYFSTFEASNISIVLQHTLLCPILLVVLNLLITIFFDIRHNAIVSDLNQNYQYFEVNIDKATSTVPEYVDYELLFDKREIKRGIPILYTYLQRRAEDEKRELERARLKNVEHEKFNFDEAGVAKSLVLERAMQEAENYIAERGKFLQDTEQINAEITQEELNFREITKEYQREMQVSKETFDNFKAQLNDVSSSIEANYLKKQQQQELDRQRNLERDYDTASDRHNQMIKALQEELDAVNEQLNQARTSLERGMMSEFDSYSQKVYADAERVVKERTNNESERQKAEISELKAQVESLTNLNQTLINNQPKQEQTEATAAENLYSQPEPQPENLNTDFAEEDVKQEDSYSSKETSSTPSTIDYQEYKNSLDDYSSTNLGYENNQGYLAQNDEYLPNLQDDNLNEATVPINVLSNAEVVKEPEQAQVVKEPEQAQVVKEPEQAQVVQTEQKTSTNQKLESKPYTGKKRGRPRKIKTEADKPKRPVGRPKKVKTEEELNKPKRGRGRPKKIIIIQEDPNDEPQETKPTNAKNISVVSISDANDINDIDNYLKEIDNQIAEENAKMEESQKELEKNTRIRKRKRK